MLNLDFTLYNSRTLLSDWWKKVMAHFKEMQAAHNALIEEAAESVRTEAAARENADGLLSQRIADEVTARASAISSLDESFREEHQTLYSTIDSERRSREEADTRLTTYLTAEESRRKNGDNALQQGIAELEGLSHSHKNSNVLDMITAKDVTAMRENTGNDLSVKSRLDMLEAVALGFINNFRELYGQHGAAVYNGGVFGEQYLNNLDCGSLTDAVTSVLDCGTLNENIFQVSII